MFHKRQVLLTPIPIHQGIGDEHFTGKVVGSQGRGRLGEPLQGFRGSSTPFAAEDGVAKPSQWDHASGHQGQTIEGDFFGNLRTTARPRPHRL